MQGYSGSYAIGGVELSLQPTEASWLEREVLNFDGNGHPIYSGVREYEMNFILSSPSDFSQLLGFFNATGNTGTVVIDLPKFGDAGYQFLSYSGCVLQEPRFRMYYAENQQEVVFRISNIRT